VSDPFFLDIAQDGSDYYGVLSDGSDQDWFKFSQSGNNLYRLTLLNSEYNWKYIHIYVVDEFGFFRELPNMTSYNQGQQAQYFIEYPYDCYMKVSGNEGPYRINVEQLQTVEPDDYQNVCEDAADQIVIDAGPVAGTLDHTDPEFYDTDWFYFQPQPLHKYRIKQTFAINSAVWFDLYDGNCQNLSWATNDMTFIPWDANDYKLYLHGDAAKYGNYYTIEIEDIDSYTDDHLNTYGGATAYTPGSGELFCSIDYEATVGSDLDYLTFEPIANTRYSFKLKNFEYSWKYLKVYQEDEFGIVQELCSTSAYNQLNECTAFFEYARTVYVRLEGNIGPYSVQIDQLDTVTDSYSNFCQSATPINIDEDVIGTLVHDSPYDVDWLSFQPVPLQKYRIRLTPASNSSVWFAVYDENCQQVYGATNDMTFIPWDAADYKLYVHGDVNKKGNYYSIKVEPLDNELYTDDWPNTRETAANLPKDGTEVDVAIEYSADQGSDVDWFTFVAALDGNYHFTIMNPEYNWDTMRIYRVNETNQLVEVRAEGAYNQFKEFDVALTEGTHFVRMEGNVGGCVITLQSPEPRCGDLDHPYPTADANRDCVVDLLDIGEMALQWLTDVRPQ
jgi:hypothetical protein